jgi:hypothetical protein
MGKIDKKSVLLSVRVLCTGSSYMLVLCPLLAVGSTAVITDAV